MTVQEFKESLNNDLPPADLEDALVSLWYVGKGDWDKAHYIAQDINDYKGSWIHAYLHRKEGDASNASYWYARAGKKMPKLSLEEEWEQISEELLNSES